MKTFLNFFLFFLLLSVGFSTAASAQDMAAKDHAMMKEQAPTVIALSQVPGAYETTSLELEAGTYIFEVTNRNVGKDLGFYLQDTDEAQVANSGLVSLIGQGQTSRTGTVTLTPGTYVYSCPLNPTPHYTVTVK